MILWTTNGTHGVAEGTRVGDADVALEQVIEAVQAFGGVAPASTSATDRGAAGPRRIDRSHEPINFASWAATRKQFSALAEDVAILLRQQGGDAELRIRMPGFDAPFTSGDEFLLNVDEELWRQRRSASFNVSARSSTVSAILTGVHMNQYSAELDVSGGLRTGRNAVIPDLTELMKRHERQSGDFEWKRVLKASPMTMFAIAYVAILVVPALIVGINGLLIGLLVSVVVTYPALELVSRAERAVSRASPDVEFLPDSGRTAWADLLESISKTQRRLVGLVVLVAAVVGILKGTGAI